MTEQTIFTTPGGWLEVIETSNKFYYARRKGRDSVAIFLVDNKEQKVLIRFQPLPRHNADLDNEQRLYPCPITGSIDVDETPLQAAIREVKEESGYENVELNLAFNYLVGTQSDEMVYLYYGFADSTLNVVGEQDGTYFESISKNQWLPITTLKDAEYGACVIFHLFYQMSWLNVQLDKYTNKN
jgi:8-oxo-dGTP diphosphatase